MFGANFLKNKTAIPIWDVTNLINKITDSNMHYSMRFQDSHTIDIDYFHFELVA